MTQIKEIEQFTQELEQIKQEYNNKINEIKTSIQNYKNNSNFEINLVRRYEETKEKYLEKGEGIVDQTLQIIDLNELILNKKQEINEITEKTNRKIKEIMETCEENKKFMIKKHNENIDEIIKIKEETIENENNKKEIIMMNYRQEMNAIRREPIEIQREREVKEILKRIECERKIFEKEREEFKKEMEQIKKERNLNNIDKRIDEINEKFNNYILKNDFEREKENIQNNGSNQINQRIRETENRMNQAIQNKKNEIDNNFNDKLRDYVDKNEFRNEKNIIQNGFTTQIREMNGKITESENKMNKTERNLNEKLNNYVKREELIMTIRKEKYMMNKKEMKQIEEWTNKKCGEVLFNSNVDDWNVNTSTFQDKVRNKENLIFLIEDEEINKFGGYLNVKIDKFGDFINDPNAFIFSLQSNRRINGMKKYPKIRNDSNSFIVWNNTNTGGGLFGFGKGKDICVYQGNRKSESYCLQYSYNYSGETNSLCSNGGREKTKFTPRRFIVIQMK